MGFNLGGGLMGGLGGALFGLGPLGILGGAALGGVLGGSGGGTTGQSLQQADIRTPEQMEILNRLIGLAQPQIGQQGRVPPSALGPLGPSALQEQAFGLAGQMPGMFAPGPGGISQAMAPVSQFAQQQFEQEYTPAIMGALGREGMARSSGAANILGRQARNLNLGLAAQFAPMQFQGQMGMPGQMANIGALQRGIPGEQQAFELSRFMQQDPLRNPAINLALQSIGTPTTENIAFQGYRQPSMLESFLPAAGMMMGGAFAGGYM